MSQRLANIKAALDVVLPTGVDLVMVNVPDYGVTPYVQTYYPDPAKRQRVADVIAQLNTGIVRIAWQRRLPVVDLFSILLTIFGPHGSPNTTLLIGNVAIGLQQRDTASGTNPTAAFVDDGIHPNTTLQGLFANVILEAANIAYDANLSLFTEAQVLAHRGIAYGGSDTLQAQIGDYGDYVINYAVPAVPALSPSSRALLCALLLATALAARRRF